jgi:hypothetical protein
MTREMVEGWTSDSAFHPQGGTPNTVQNFTPDILQINRLWVTVEIIWRAVWHIGAHFIAKPRPSL